MPARLCRAGAAHWEVLLRARAIECQAYVIAAAQAGRHNDKRESYGHALIISPWGEVVGALDDPQATGARGAGCVVRCMRVSVCVHELRSTCAACVRACVPALVTLRWGGAAPRAGRHCRGGAGL